MSVEGAGPVPVSRVLQAMIPDLVGVRDRTLDEHGRLRPHMNIFVAGESVRSLEGMDTEVSADDEVVIFPAVSGG